MLMYFNFFVLLSCVAFQVRKNKRGDAEEILPVWPVSRSSLQDLILFFVGNCIVRKHAKTNVKRIWSVRNVSPVSLFVYCLISLDGTYL